MAKQRIAVVTDSNDPELRQLFHIGIKLQPALGQQVEQKIFLNVYSPFGRTMFIDSDCLTTRSLEQLWTKFEAVPFGVVGEQRYGGFHEYWLGGQEMAIRAKDNEIFIEFAAKGNNPVRLKLVNDNRLEGTINIVLKRAVNRRIWLDKVTPKAGDIK